MMVNWATWIAVYLLSSPVRTFLATKVIQRSTDCLVDSVLRWPFTVSWRRRRWTSDSLYWSTLHHNIQMTAQQIDHIVKTQTCVQNAEAVSHGFEMLENGDSTSSSSTMQTVVQSTVQTTVQTNVELEKGIVAKKNVELKVELEKETVERNVEKEKQIIEMMAQQLSLYHDFEEAVRQLGHDDKLVRDAGHLMLQGLQYVLSEWLRSTHYTTGDSYSIKHNDAVDRTAKKV